MAFDDDLRAYLDSVGRGAPTLSAKAYRQVDEHILRGHLLTRLREAESARPSWVTAMHAAWDPRIPRLARFLERLPPGAAPADADGTKLFTSRVLDRALDRLDDVVPLVERLEIERILEGFNEEGNDIERYALECHLARREGVGEVRLTGLGRAFLRLRGKDAVRWLLTSELVQSMGARDPWRAPRQLVEEALSPQGITPSFDPEGGEYYFQYVDATLSRLGQLGVLTGWIGDEEEGVYKYTVPPALHDVARAALDSAPWQAAVAALLEDEREIVVRGAGPSPSETSVEQTRMITHEVRNALVPVRHHLDAMSDLVMDERARERIGAARRGVVRVLEFVDQMVAMSELVAERAVSVDVADAVREALAWVDGGERIRLDAGAPLARIRAAQSRFTRAVSNVLLNAAQAAPAPALVRASIRVDGGEVQIRVDDSGAGVPAVLRSRVFEDGFTTRAGGSGFGLAFARKVIVDELGGKVWCEDSDLGGARFVIAIPNPETKQ